MCVVLSTYLTWVFSLATMFFGLKKKSFCCFGFWGFFLFRSGIITSDYVQQLSLILCLHLGIPMVNFYIEVVVFEINYWGTSDRFVCVINAVVALTVVL
jgi:hypothetical protein